MRQIYPAGRGAAPGNGCEGGGGAGARSGASGEVDLAAAYAYPPDGPWVRANMVASTDGAATVAGRSAGLSGEADHRLFALLRCLADVILVGAQTVRVEDYGPSRTRPEWAGLRAGRPPSAPIAVVTRRIDLDVSSRLFTGTPAHARTIVITTEAAPPRRRRVAARYADVVVAGKELVDLPAAVALLARRGYRRILTEGGPRLLGELAAAGVLDELCLTVSPLLACGDGGRITAGAAAAPRPLRLAHVLEADSSLFCRYVRAT